MKLSQRRRDLLLKLNVLLLTISSTKCSNHGPNLSKVSSACLSRGILLSPTNFQAETCALCYSYMPSSLFTIKWTKTFVSNVLAEEIYTTSDSIPDASISILTNGNLTVVANHTDPNNPLLQSFSKETSYHLWYDCCEAAIRCCETMSESQSKEMEEEIKTARCPPTWDGWQCWKDGGAAGVIEKTFCPKYIFFHTHGQLMQNTCEKNAEKLCLPSGQWYVKPGSMSEWTNFTTCIEVNNLIVQEHTHIAMYGISVAALLPAIIIFFSYKTLRVPRIAIHKNMFGSLLLHCVFMINFKGIILLPFVENPMGETTLEKNSNGCKILLMLTKYFRLTNYTWMFCEGYYLHHLLANTFEKERSLAFILVIGWGFPMIPCLAYAFLRLIYDDNKCWTMPVDGESAWIEWIYMAPGLICILSNFIFFVNITRILLTKLQAPHANEPIHFRKAVRATVVLLPLFGLHWVLTLYRPQSGDCLITTFYKYLNIILDGLQGLIVSIAFCYRNGEIQNLLKAGWNRTLEKYFPKGRTTNIQLSEFPTRGGSDTCITQVPQQGVSTLHQISVEENKRFRSPLTPTNCQNTLSTSFILENQNNYGNDIQFPKI